MNGSAVAPAAIAGAVAAAKDLLRLDGAGEDGALARVAAAAIALAEQFCGEALLQRACEEAVAADGRWHRLATAPVLAIEAVAAGEVAADYAADIGPDGEGWVKVAAGPGAGGGLTVFYRAGRAADWDAVPAPLALGVAMLAAHLFEHREGEAAPPAAVAALWRPFRRMRLSRERRA